MTGIHVLEPAGAAAAAALLARGFAADPAKATLVPDPDALRIINEISARTRLHDALRYGTAHEALIDGTPAASAVWVSPGVRTLSVGAALRVLLRSFPHVPALARTVPDMVSAFRTDITGLVSLPWKRHRAVARASRGTTWRSVRADGAVRLCPDAAHAGLSGRDTATARRPGPLERSAGHRRPSPLACSTVLGLRTVSPGDGGSS